MRAPKNAYFKTCYFYVKSTSDNFYRRYLLFKSVTFKVVTFKSVTNQNTIKVKITVPYVSVEITCFKVEIDSLYELEPDNKYGSGSIPKTTAPGGSGNPVRK